MNRDIYIDRLRGLAIFTMVFANMGPLLKMEHPFWMRLCGSFAAPIFFTLIAMLVAYTAFTKSYNWKHFFLKAILILLSAVFVDIAAYGIVPFVSADVLYMLSIALFTAYLCNRLSTKTIAGLMLIIITLTPILQHIMGYTSYPTEIYLSGGGATVTGQTSILNHWVIDGWFPFFPWIVFSLFGLILARLRWNNGNLTQILSSYKSLVIGLVTLTAGAFIWYLNPGQLYNREGFSELFYPATTGYLITSIGILLCLFYAVKSKRAPKLWDLVQVLGESSLFMYFFHNIIIWKFLYERYEPNNMPLYLLEFGVFILVMLVLGFMLRKIKQKYKNIPYAIKFIIGT